MIKRGRLARDSVIPFIDDPQLFFLDGIKVEITHERYCFMGSIDDWIDIGGPGPLRVLAVRFVKQLGEESFFELF